MTIKIGDKVWFISKFDDVVTGIYQGESSIPGLGGAQIPGHSVLSDNAFGPDSGAKAVDCWVPLGKLNAGEPPAMILFSGRLH